MRIPHAGYIDSAQISSESAKATGSKAAASLSQSASGLSGTPDNVELSGVSKLLQSGSSQRSAKIARLANLVQSGQYGVSAADVSESLVSETLAQAGYNSQPGYQS